MSRRLPSPRCRIIGLGNSLHIPDSAGPATLQLLVSMTVQQDIELIDGGLGGLNLLSFLEHVNTVIFVDAVAGFPDGPGIKVLRLPSDEIEIPVYDHNGGLGYLMEVAPAVIETDMPDCYLVGVQGYPGKKLCRQAARTCLLLACATRGKRYFTRNS